MKYLLAFLLVSGCAHKIQNEHIVSSLNDPDQVCLKPVQEFKTPFYKVRSTLEKTTGTTASLLATGLGYTGDAVYMVGTYGGSLALCTGFGKGNANGGECMQMFWEIIPFPTMGKSTFKGTRSWRCPEIALEAEALKEVANCYRDKGYLVEAEEQLKIIENSSIFRNCIR